MWGYLKNKFKMEWIVLNYSAIVAGGGTRALACRNWDAYISTPLVSIKIRARVQFCISYHKQNVHFWCCLLISQAVRLCLPLLRLVLITVWGCRQIQSHSIQNCRKRSFDLVHNRTSECYHADRCNVASIVIESEQSNTNDGTQYTYNFATKTTSAISKLSNIEQWITCKSVVVIVSSCRKNDSDWRSERRIVHEAILCGSHDFREGRFKGRSVLGVTWKSIWRSAKVRSKRNWLARRHIDPPIIKVFQTQVSNALLKPCNFITFTAVPGFSLLY